MSLILEILEKSKNTKELLSFVKYRDDDSLWCGYVIDYSDEFVIIQHFTKFGKNDGVIVHPIDSFQRITFNDDYSTVMQCVIDYSDEIYRPIKIDLQIDKTDNLYLKILRTYLGSENNVVSVQINNDQFTTGYVTAVADDDFSMLRIGVDGEDMGIAILKTEDITSIQIDDVDNRKRNLLYKWRKASL